MAGAGMTGERIVMQEKRKIDEGDAMAKKMLRDAQIRRQTRELSMQFHASRVATLQKQRE
jgi:hypothetical protein